MSKIMEFETLLNSYSKEKTSQIRSFFKLSAPHFQPDESANALQMIVKTLIENESQTLVALYAGIFSNLHENLLSDDLDILDLLLFYLNIKLFCCQHTNEIFLLTNEEKGKLQEIYEILENWHSSLKQLYELNNKFETKKFDDYITNLHQNVQNLPANSFLIIPNGFKKVQHHKNSNSSTLELVYQPYSKIYKILNHSSSIIIKNEGNIKNVQVSIIDPLSPYVPILQDDISEKTIISLNFSQVIKEDLTKVFLEIISKMKILKPTDCEFYYFSNFYEGLLPTIKGNLLPSDYSKDFYPNSDIGLTKSSILCIKNTLLFLLKEKFGEKATGLFECIWIEFNFLFLNEFQTLFKISQNLLKEMVVKIAKDSNKFSSLLDVKKICKLIDAIEKENVSYLNRKKMEKNVKLKIGDLSYKNSTKFSLHGDLFKMNFIFRHLKIVKLDSTSLKPHNLYPELEPKQGLVKIFELFNNYIQKCKVDFDLNSVSQIHQSIENFILFLLFNNLAWKDAEYSSKIEAFSKMMDYALTYYSCSYRIICELYQEGESCYYDPQVQKRLVLTMYSIMIIVHQWCLDDKKIGILMKEYNLPMDFPTKKISFKEIFLEKIFLPDKKWVKCKNKIIQYHEQNQGKPKYLFNYYERYNSKLKFTSDSDKKEEIMIFLLNLIKLSNPETYNTIMVKNFNTDVEKKEFWRKQIKNSSSPYTPKYYINFKQISYLCMYSVYGFSNAKILEDVKDNFKKLKGWKYSFNYSHRVIKSSLRQHNHLVDLNRCFFVAYPNNKLDYQKLITKTKDLNENYVIANQREKPMDTTKPQYLNLKFIVCNQELAIQNLYCSLKTQDLSFDREEDYYFIKNVLYNEKADDKFTTNLEKMMNNLEFADAFVESFIKSSEDILIRINQINSSLNKLSIIKDFYNVSSETIQKKINEFFKKVRFGLQKNLTPNLKDLIGPNMKNSTFENKYFNSLLSSYCILTYNLQSNKEFTQIDVEMILKSRKIIADNFNYVPKVCLPSKIYFEVIQTMNSFNFEINKLVSNNPQILENIFGSNTSDIASLWSKDGVKNIFIKGSYSLILSQGLLFTNGIQSGRLPQQILNHPDFIEYGGYEFPAIKKENEIFPGTLITTCNFQNALRNDKDPFIKIWMLDQQFSNICIQEKTCENEQYLTFVPKRYFEKILPHAVITNYKHWFHNDSIFIKNNDLKKETKFIINIKDNSGEITSLNHDGRKLVPLENCNKDLQYIFTNFEDKRYILILEDEIDKNNYSILLPRLNLHFFCDTKNKYIKSLDYLNYVLSIDQYTTVFENFKNYLIIEPLVNQTLNLSLKKKILIPHRTIINRKSKKYGHYNKWHITMDMSSFYQPKYFSYEIDENIGRVISENNPSAIFLALLFYRTAELGKNDLTNMNGWEMSSEILKNCCWQNYLYSEEELRMFLKFFELRQDKIDKSELSKLFLFGLLINDEVLDVVSQNGNSIAICLRILYLLNSCQQTMLFAQNANLNNIVNEKINVIKYRFIPDYLNLYLILKENISKNCLLSKNEEMELLTLIFDNKSDFFLNKPEYMSKSLSKYYNRYSISESKLKILPEKCIDFRSTCHNFISQSALKNYNFPEFTKNQLENLSEGYFINIDVQNLTSHCINQDFDFFHFISYYHFALTTRPDIFKFSIMNLLLKINRNISIDYKERKICLLKILYIVNSYPGQFKSILPPKFIFSNDGKINQSLHFFFRKDKFILNEECLPSFTSNYDATQISRIKKEIWKQIINFKFLDQNGNFLRDLKSQDWDYYYEEFWMKKKDEVISSINEVLTKENIINNNVDYSKNVHDNFSKILRTKLVYDFLLIVCEKCQKIKEEFISRFLNIQINDQRLIITRNLTQDQFDKEVENQRSELELSKMAGSELETINWQSVDHIKAELNKFYSEVNNFFQSNVHFPETQDFVLDVQKLPKGCSAEITFNTPYGKMFIDDLKKSFTNSEICKINSISYEYQEKQISYQQILNSLITNLQELIPDFVHNLQKEKAEEIINNIFDDFLIQNIYLDLLPQNKNGLLKERFKNIILDESWKDLIAKFDEFQQYYLDLIQELNELNGKNLILRWDKSEITKKIQEIQDFKTKKKFRNDLRDCEDFELEIEETKKKVHLSVDVMQVFTEWSIETRNIKVFKYFENYLNSNLELYQPDDIDPKLFKLIKSKSIVKPNSVKTLSLLERKDGFKEIQILRPATSEVFAGPGYLETEKKAYKLAENKNISELKSFLLQKLKIYEGYSEYIWEEIYSKFHMAGSEKKQYQLLFLQQISCIQSSLNKFDILRLIDQDRISDKSLQVQVTILIPKEELAIRTKIYMLAITLIQQIQRTLLMIFSYENVTSKPQELQDNDQKDGKFLIFQDIAVSIITERSYKIDEYPMFLLFELENDVLIRKTQTNLLKAMQEKENGVYQMNMGEGKTSVILILLIKLLSNPINIIRINALEPLMGVMHEILRKKFSSLLKKKVFLLPFSRNAEFSYESIKKIQDLLTECKEGNHILLMTPEHRLCFQLKLQEIFLDYAQTRNADDKFDWDLHLTIYRCNGNYDSEIKKNQPQLKKIFQELGYIDQNDKIIKFPDWSTYIDQVWKKKSQIKDNGLMGISDAYDVLKQKSKLFKNSIQNKLNILNNIANLTYLDVLDESDEILRYGKELNYTLGTSKDFDGGSGRWFIPFKLLNMIFFDPEIRKILVEGNQLIKLTLDKDWRPQNGIGGGVCFIQLSDQSFFEDNLKPKLAYNILIEILKKCNKNDSPNKDIVSEEKGSYLQFIMGELSNRKDKSSHSPELVISLTLKNVNKNLLTYLLIAKAWLTHGLLYHIISYRYRVNYGLLDFDNNDSNKENAKKEIAIPFKGKDLPSERSEFSHPEIMIGFTILSYFYNGLSCQQMRKILVQLKSSKNNADIEYFSNCVNNSKGYIMDEIKRNQIPYPEWLHSLDKLDFDDKEKLNIIWKYLARNVDLIEFYLSSFTFPEKCKFFKKKLTGNSHDISGEGATKGFSGTDDRNDTMPESIISKRLPDQFGTNGKMLHIMSRSVNKTYRVIQINSIKEFLGKVCEYANNSHNRCYLLIDSGAMITEMANLTAAKILLEGFTSFFKGVGYFCDETNIVKVLLRNGEQIPLSTCPLDKSELFIYLDEVHTRGTDLKFPLTAKGIVTVGKNISKDKFMQAVMRLRQLDFKQSVEIWGNRDISNEIANVNDLKNLNELNSSHVIVWVTYNTIEKNLKDLYPVLIEKIKYIVKKRALDYQIKNINIPVAALIGECEVSVIDELESLYAESPSLVDPMNVIDKRISFIFGEFWTRLEKELGKIKEKLANNNEHLKFLDHLKADKNKDYEYIRVMVDKTLNKLPEKIWIAVGELNSSQENEKEMEEMQIIELAPVPVRIRSDEMSWKDYNVIFNNFIQGCFDVQQTNYPKIFSLKEALEGCDISIYNKLKWSQNIYITENFKTTVQTDKSKGEFQNNYLRPINAILFFRDSGSFVCLSGKEASSIKKVIEARVNNNGNVFMMLLNDFDGPTTIPCRANIISDKITKKCLVLLKFFNGECMYQEDEIPFLESCMGKIKLIFQESIFQGLNEKLNKSKNLNKGFLTNMAQIELTNKSKFPNFEQNEMEEINNKIETVISDSIATDYESLSYLPSLALKLINMRGRSHEYEQSAIYKIIN